MFILLVVLVLFLSVFMVLYFTVLKKTETWVDYVNPDKNSLDNVMPSLEKPDTEHAEYVKFTPIKPVDLQLNYNQNSGVNIDHTGKSPYEMIM